jgi:hypothetical protein
MTRQCYLAGEAILITLQFLPPPLPTTFLPPPLPTTFLPPPLPTTTSGHTCPPRNRLEKLQNTLEDGASVPPAAREQGHGGVAAAVVTLPSKFRYYTGVASLAAGFEHACARMMNGSVACWGCNDYGQLGQGYISSSILSQYPPLRL